MPKVDALHGALATRFGLHILAASLPRLDADGRYRNAARLGYVPASQPWREADLQACVGDYTTSLGGVRVRREGRQLRAEVADQTLDLLEGEAGVLGLRYKLAGLIPLPLGPLAELGVSCRRVDGRELLVARLDGQEMLAGARLAPVEAPLQPEMAALAGRYEPELAPGERPTFEAVTVEAAEGRLWVRPQMAAAFGGGAAARFPLQVLSADEAVMVGPLADTGTVITRLPGPEGARRRAFARRVSCFDGCREAGSGLDLDALAEGHAVLDRQGRFGRRGVVPDRVRQRLAVDEQRVVTRLALPGAVGALVAVQQVLGLERGRGEIVVAFDEHSVVALGQYHTVPDRFHVGFLGVRKGVGFTRARHRPGRCRAG